MDYAKESEMDDYDNQYNWLIAEPKELKDIESLFPQEFLEDGLIYIWYQQVSTNARPVAPI